MIAGLYLLSDDTSDLNKRQGNKAVVVHSYIILRGKQSARQRVSFVLDWICMNMAKQLPHLLVCSAITKKRVVAKLNLLLAHFNQHLHGNAFEPVISIAHSP